MFFEKLGIHDIFAFLLGLGIGIFLVYIMHPIPRIIIKHPTPLNAGKIIYKNDDNNCYKYEANEITCPYDSNVIVEHPLIINE